MRSRVGDWEGNTVFGQDAHLVTLVDRKSRFTLIGKVDTKHAESVANKMIELLKRVSSVNTITLDNGGEFAAHEKVAKAINADMPAISGEPTKTPMASFGEPGPGKWPWAN